MIWDYFNYLGPLAALFWLAAGWQALVKKNKRAVVILTLAGIVCLGLFIGLLWHGQMRPPFRTMGETRLWYSFFLAGAGLWTYLRWPYVWLPAFSNLLAVVFVIINLAKPEIHSITLMPALQSPFFIPHVTAYMLSYAMMAVATITSIILLRKGSAAPEPELHNFLDNVVYLGFGFLMLGLLSGALWAKEAWGNYWSWDPKETWAFITASAYLIFIHLRLRKAFPKLALVMLPLALVLLMITWLGVSYLPSAQGSVHVYS